MFWSNFKRNILFPILFQQCKCIHVFFFYFGQIFIDKLFRESVFSHVGHATVVENQYFGCHIETVFFLKKFCLPTNGCQFLGVNRNGGSLVGNILTGKYFLSLGPTCAQTAVKNSSRTSKAYVSELFFTQSQSATVYFFCTISYTVAVCDCVFLLYDFLS